MPVQTRKRSRRDNSAVEDTGSDPIPTAKRLKGAKEAGSEPTKVATISDETINIALPSVTPSRATMKVACLLRAVNVSGSNPCNMKRLVQLATDTLGWGNVKTYLQSGNLVADVPGSLSIDDVVEKMRQLLAKNMKVHCAVVVRTLPELDTLVSNCPYDTSDPTKVHAFFLSSKPTQVAFEKLDQKPKKDDRYTWDGGNHLYLSYPNGAGRAVLNGSVLERSLHAQGTGRNWRSVLAVRDLLAC